MTQRESRLSAKIKNDLRVQYGSRLFVFKVWGSEHMMAGLPDLIGCLDGKFFGLEVKLPESRANVSARQSFVMDLIRGAMGITAIVCSTAEARDVLDRMIQSSEG